MKQKELKITDMEEVSGGALASSFINAVTKAIGALYDLGVQTGSAIRRAISNKYCPTR